MLLWRIIRNKYGMLILGVIALAVGLFMLNRSDVTCGNEVMQAGDVCEHTKAGRTISANSLEDEQSSQHTAGIVLTVVGGGFLLGGAGWVIGSMARRKPAESVQAGPVATA